MHAVRALLMTLLLLPAGPVAGAGTGSDDVPVKFTADADTGDLGLVQFSRMVLDKFSERMPPGALEGLAVHFHRQDADPADVPADFAAFPRELVFQGDYMTLNVLIDTDWRNHRQALARTLCLGLVQAISWRGNARATLAELPEPPLWLSEGLTQWCHTEAQEDLDASVLMPTIKYLDVSPLAEPLRQVVWKASRSGRAPSLDEIQRWDQLPELRVEKFWRQAFSYWVFEAATRSPSGRAAVYNWIRAQALITPEPYWKGTRVEANWWRQQVQRAETPTEYLLDWERSAQTIRDLLLCQFSDPETGKAEMLRLADLPAPPQDAVIRRPTLDPGTSNDRATRGEALRLRVLGQMQQLGQLESRAHPLTRPAIEAYIGALRFWLAGQTEKYRATFAEGNERMSRAGVYHEKINDRLDWVIVNYDFSFRAEGDIDYTAWVRELSRERDKVRRQARPSSPPSTPF